jgi:hypothetical protein
MKMMARTSPPSGPVLEPVASLEQPPPRGDTPSAMTAAPNQVRVMVFLMGAASARRRPPSPSGKQWDIGGQLTKKSRKTVTVAQPEIPRKTSVNGLGRAGGG